MSEKRRSFSVWLLQPTRSYRKLMKCFWRAAEVLSRLSVDIAVNHVAIARRASVQRLVNISPHSARLCVRVRASTCLYCLLVVPATWLMERLSAAKSIRAPLTQWCRLYASSSEWKESLWNMTSPLLLLMLLMPQPVISSLSGVLAYTTNPCFAMITISSSHYSSTCLTQPSV